MVPCYEKSQKACIFTKDIQRYWVEPKVLNTNQHDTKSNPASLVVTLGSKESPHCWSAFLDPSYTPASCITDEMDPVVPDGLRAPLSAHTFQLGQAETSLQMLNWLAVKSICLLNNMVNSTTCSTQ